MRFREFYDRMSVAWSKGASISVTRGNPSITSRGPRVPMIKGPAAPKLHHIKTILLVN